VLTPWITVTGLPISRAIGIDTARCGHEPSAGMGQLSDATHMGTIGAVSGLYTKARRLRLRNLVGLSVGAYEGTPLASRTVYGSFHNFDGKSMISQIMRPSTASKSMRYPDFGEVSTTLERNIGAGIGRHTNTNAYPLFLQTWTAPSLSERENNVVCITGAVSSTTSSRRTRSPLYRATAQLGGRFLTFSPTPRPVTYSADGSGACSCRPCNRC